jgi:uncharacterized protein (TIGR02599 family)
MSHETRRGGRRGAGGFSLVELLVAIAILSILVLVMANLIALTSKTYLQTTVKVGQFAAAQAGFESMTRRLSQATLNTYLDYEDASNKTDQAYVSSSGGATTFVPTHYGRQSELRFIAGNIAPAGSASFAGSYDPNFGTTSIPCRPTQAIFFAAPLNETASTSGNVGLSRLLNVCGYYIEYNSDPEIPGILQNVPGVSKRYRFRLMEMNELTENLSIYADVASTTPYVGHGWFTGPLTGNDADTGKSEPACSSVLAENIVALIFLPRLSPENEAYYSGNPAVAAATLAPDYFYDSTTVGKSGYYSGTQNGFNLAGGANTINQLPPLVQVTMVAIDEPSAIRLQARFGAVSPPSAALLNQLYAGPSGGALFTDATQYATDLTNFQLNLTKLHLTYHVFQTNVGIKEARWSSLQTGS